jgi:hypothetical protein
MYGYLFTTKTAEAFLVTIFNFLLNLFALINHFKSELEFVKIAPRAIIHFTSFMAHQIETSKIGGVRV